ncbi:MAG TPA: right-handed parallel beta-helix repeat-containing protein [Candidatus Nanoarchaeia archaeon]|nr:right-handed parallel beta-helix repeat-containing protein [Candidatus Nanoarchaeia archaeon]
MKRGSLFLVSLVFLLGLISLVSADENNTEYFPAETECGSSPTNGCTISVDTTFDGASYNLSTGIFIQNNGITLDCNFSMLTGIRTSPNTQGITVAGYTGTQIKNCYIEDYVKGIVLSGSTTDDNELNNNTIIRNDIGIYFKDGADLNRIINNRIPYNYNSGVIFETGNKNLNSFENNDLIFNSNYAFSFISDATNGSFTGNTIWATGDLYLINPALYSITSGGIEYRAGAGAEGNVYTNNLIGNIAPQGYAFFDNHVVDALAETNCWNTASTNKISDLIYDFYDNPAKGYVDFIPFSAGADCPGAYISDVIPTQVVANVSLVKGKTTLVRVKVTYYDAVTNQTTLTTNLTVNDTSGQLYSVVNETSNIPGGDSLDIDFFITGDAFNFTDTTDFRVDVLPGGYGYNDTRSVSMNVVETRPLDLFFVQVNEVNSFGDSLLNNVNFIQRTYPVPNEGISTTTGARITIDVPTSSQDEIMWELRRKIMAQTFLSKDFTNKTYINAVGIVPDNFLDNIGFGVSGVNFIDKARIFADVILIEESNVNTLAHEVGHTFELCEEYDSQEWITQNSYKSCPNGDLDNNNALDTVCLNNDGCPTNTLPPIYASYGPITENDILKNFMGGPDGTPPYPSFISWVSNDTYEVLINRLEVGSNFDKSLNYIAFVGKYLLLQGKLSKINNSFEASPYYGLENGFVNNQSSYSGGYSFEVLDANNQVISSINFEPLFFYTSQNGTVVETNFTSLIFAIPTDETAAKIQLKNGTILINELNKTPNSPVIKLNYPFFGTSVIGLTNITWESSDADNDTLYHSLILHKQNGDNTTIDFDLNETTYLFNFSTVLGDKDYSLTLLTTDGFNTATAESGIFCVNGNLSVCGLNLLSTNQTTVIFEFIITNTLNQTEENINWTLDTGDANVTSMFNFNLTTYEDIFIYIEHAYGSGGSYQITATASNTNFTDSQSINITI